jgi:c-di-GMP-binding flagellar brake protein YcgR
MRHKAAERRKHKRSDLACPAAVKLHDGEPAVRGRTINLSDGGCLVSLPLPRLPPFGEKVRIRLAVPRTTPNTHMLEEFACEARVIRQEPMREEQLAAVALRFDHPVPFVLEV